MSLWDIVEDIVSLVLRSQGSIRVRSVSGDYPPRSLGGGGLGVVEVLTWGPSPALFASSSGDGRLATAGPPPLKLEERGSRARFDGEGNRFVVAELPPGL